MASAPLPPPPSSFAGFPRARCGTCGRQDACAARGLAEPDYPRCHRPLLRASLRRHEQLFARLIDGAAAAVSDEARALVGGVLRRFERDRRTVSEVLEPSLSLSGEGWSGLRFSYAFHGFRRDPRDATESARRLLSPFGEGALAVAEPALRLAEESAAVRQLLLGYAHDGGRERLKLYLELDDEAASEAPALVERLLPGSFAAGAGGGLPLHLLGIDFHADGLRGAKLYFREHDCDLDGEAAREVPLLAALRALGPRRLRDLLWIHRAAPGRPAAPVADEIDFALADNELRWADLAAIPLLSRHRADGTPLHALERDFRLAVRRLSAPRRGEAKLNVYYMLAEADADA